MELFREQKLKHILEGKRILLAGYGREGKSSHRLIQQLLPQADVAIAEGNDNICREAAKGYDLIIKSPGIPTFIFDGICSTDIITSQTDIFLRCYGDATIGVTGTKGKSTTTSLLYHALSTIFKETEYSALLAGNIGIPLFDIIPSMDDNTLVVAEFSCHQLENIHRAPVISILLNLFQEHLDHYRSYLDYQMAKMNIALKQSPDSLFVYCRDNADLAALAGSLSIPSTTVAYGIADTQPGQPLHWIAELPRTLVGDHNLCNILAVWHALKGFDIDHEQFAQIVGTFKALEHRMEHFADRGGIQFYNDSISTIPQATIAAVEALPGVDTLILGGFDRGIDYTPLVDYLATHPLRNLVFVGQAGRRILDLWQPHASASQRWIVSDDYAAIVDWCFANTEPGHACLLSPAAASYDSFKNFEERGRRFKELVQAHKC
ncbi:MAG: UDP-N-acetylmuramoyl-L-alanine--D-glutamate ligase [Bacteroidales bacterium]|nr:UDP-N-acetylmuramoyl-L-alanine--D-glutamate ligase [Bacteroidales bacterium]